MKLTGNATAAALPPCRNTLPAGGFVPGARTRIGTGTSTLQKNTNHEGKNIRSRSP